jgi:hypothetical protein
MSVACVVTVAGSLEAVEYNLEMLAILAHYGLVKGDAQSAYILYSSHR